MRFRDLLPPALLEWRRLLLQRHRFPLARIDSGLMGAGVVVGRGVWIARGVEIGDGVRIGDRSYVNAGSVVTAASIGKYCSIGYHAQIGPDRHPLTALSTSPFVSRQDERRDAVIGNDVWIGANAVVMQSVKVGDGAVVGAGAVVTHDVPPYGIAAGVPARIIRFRFSPHVIEWLLTTRWWDREPAEWDCIQRAIGHAGEREAVCSVYHAGGSH